MGILNRLSRVEDRFNAIGIQLPPFLGQYVDGIWPEGGDQLNYRMCTLHYTVMRTVVGEELKCLWWFLTCQCLPQGQFQLVTSEVSRQCQRSQTNHHLHSVLEGCKVLGTKRASSRDCLRGIASPEQSIRIITNVTQYLYVHVGHEMLGGQVLIHSHRVSMSRLS